MFVSSLLPLPPPPTSLLPNLSQPATEPVHQQHVLHPQSRRKPANRQNTSLVSLSHDERLVASRKLGIAMYGYSWLKPAGCTKTMLGRREEELEREEVERQLREVELQERMAMEQEEQERREELRRQADGGQVEGIAERDLDEDVPEADDEEPEGSEGNEEEEEDGMEGDLDDEIPDADADGLESSWVYDTRREPDTESENDRSDEGGVGDDDDQEIVHLHPRQPRNQRIQREHPRRSLAGAEDPAATEAMVNAMLDEDELGEYEHQHDLDDDVPDMDMDVDLDMDADLSDRDLDDEVLSAEEEPGWEHTDSELEESEMDISLLPPHPNSSSRNPGTTHEEMRRVSGNRMLPPPLPPPSQSRTTGQSRQEHNQPRTAPRRNPRQMMATPQTADEVSALISSTGGISETSTNPPVTAEDSPEPRSPNRRAWLNPAGARRNLFGGFRGGNTNATESTTGSGGQTRNALTGVSSGGLFTPSPRHATGSDGEGVPEQPRSRTRSGRLLGGLQVGRRARRLDGET